MLLALLALGGLILSLVLVPRSLALGALAISVCPCPVGVRLGRLRFRAVRLRARLHLPVSVYTL